MTIEEGITDEKVDARTPASAARSSAHARIRRGLRRRRRVLLACEEPTLSSSTLATVELDSQRPTLFVLAYGMGGGTSDMSCLAIEELALSSSGLATLEFHSQGQARIALIHDMGDGFDVSLQTIKEGSSR